MRRLVSTMMAAMAIVVVGAFAVSCGCDDTKIPHGEFTCWCYHTSKGFASPWAMGYKRLDTSECDLEDVHREKCKVQMPEPPAERDGLIDKVRCELHRVLNNKDLVDSEIPYSDPPPDPGSVDAPDQPEPEEQSPAPPPSGDAADGIPG